MGLDLVGIQPRSSAKAWCRHGSILQQGDL